MLPQNSLTGKSVCGYISSLFSGYQEENAELFKKPAI
jgi:hypothetical protein